MFRTLIIAIIISGLADAATWDKLPLAIGLHDADPWVVEQGIGKSHPWKPGDALPANFKDAGLEAPVKLVACDIYADGGSRYYIFRGANDRFLLLCTDSGISYSSQTKKVSKVEKPRLYLAASNYGSESKVEVPADSVTEQFLLGAITSEVARIAVTARPPTFAASRIASPVHIISPTEEKKVRDLSQLNHPWTKERSLPTSLADCGLEGDAKLVVASLYLDGGSRLFALKDGKGAYFVFCTSKPRSQAKRDGDLEWNEHFVAGAKHYLEKDGVSVPRGSPAEAFLLKVISGLIFYGS